VPAPGTIGPKTEGILRPMNRKIKINGGKSLVSLNGMGKNVDSSVYIPLGLINGASTVDGISRQGMMV